jgi:hypothetical protein
MSDSQAASAQAQAVHQAEVQQMPVVSGLMMLGFIVVSLGVFEFVGLKFLRMGVEVFFCSYLLLWHWATVEKAEFTGLPASLIGALAGLALAWQSSYLTARFGMPNGLVMGLIPVIIALFIVIMNWLPMVFNSSTMLFVTVLGAPLAKTDFLKLGEAAVIGAIFFAAAVYLAKVYVDVRTKSKLSAQSKISAKAALSA